MRSPEGCMRRSGTVEDERPQLYALARQHINRSGRVFEGRVGGEPCLVRRGIVAFYQHRLVSPHLRYVEPAVIGVVFDAVDLAHQVTNALWAGIDGVVIVDGGDRLTRYSHRPIDAAPDAAADRVVEYQHPAGAGNFGDETLGFGIIDAAQFVLVIEIPNRAMVLDQG